MATFTQQVITIVRAIPRGATLSYKEVACLAGNCHAARAVGMIMKNNADPTVPCHRVIRSDGSVGGYNGLRGVKEKLLKDEHAI